MFYPPPPPPLPTISADALRRLMTRVDDLERDCDQKDETIRKMEEVHTKHADGLLATIEDLQSEVERAVEQLAKERASCPCKCKARGDDDAGCACVTPALAFGKSCHCESLPIASTVNHSSVEQDDHRELSQKKVREKNEEKRVHGGANRVYASYGTRYVHGKTR